MNNDITVTKSTLPEYNDYIDEIADLWESRWISNNGEKCKKLELALCRYLDCKNMVLFNNGHSALESVINAFELNGEIITTPFTFISTTHAIVRNGIKPIFCDIKKDDFTIDTDLIEEKITKKTSAILPVHVYGNICEIEKIERIAKKHNIKVIYDAAHALGNKYHGKDVSGLGDATMYSFHATKVFNTIEGGAIVSDEPEIIRKLKCLQNFGFNKNGCVEFVGFNAKMNEFQAAMGICNLKNLHNDIIERKEQYNLYKEILGDIPGIHFPKNNPEVNYNYSYMPILFDGFKKNRNEIIEELNKQRIFPRKYFFPLTKDEKCYSGKFYDFTPVAKQVAEQILTMPLYKGLEKKDIHNICSIILK